MNKQNNVKRAHRVLEIARAMAEKFPGYAVRNHIEGIELHSAGYAEPGYNSDLVATGNWNDVIKYDNDKKERVLVSDLPSRVGNLLEKLGFECEWSDEWSTCNDCGKLVRTSADSYSWQASFAILNECELVCHECLQDHAEDYLSSLEGNDRTCNTIESIDPTDYDYIKVNSDAYETGFHPGQNDDPKKIAKELKDRGIERFLFNLDEASQFYSKWSVYVHKDDYELLSDNATSEDSSEE